MLKVHVRKALLRWHPDKFVNAYGSRVVAEERETVLEKVNDVSQAINAFEMSLKSEIPSRNNASGHRGVYSRRVQCITSTRLPTAFDIEHAHATEKEQPVS